MADGVAINSEGNFMLSKKVSIINIRKIDRKQKRRYANT